MWKFILALVLFATPAFSQLIKAGTVRDFCQTALQAGGSTTECSGYVKGVLDANSLWYAAMLKEKHLEVLTKFYCAPDDLEAKDAAKLFVDWLGRNPKFEDQPAANVLALALKEKYSCK
jgi:Rap1a immunity proteins